MIKLYVIKHYILMFHHCKDEYTFGFLKIYVDYKPLFGGGRKAMHSTKKEVPHNKKVWEQLVQMHKRLVSTMMEM